MKRTVSSFLTLWCLGNPLPATADAGVPADLIIHHAKVVTVDAQFHIVQAIAVKDGRILALGGEEIVKARTGPRTRIIDARGQPVLPGLYDSHLHSVDAAASEMAGLLPSLKSIRDVQDYVRTRAAAVAPGEWIVIPCAFPTRLREARFPTRGELDEAAPRHPVFYHAGPAAVVNGTALRLSGITRDTPSPPSGVIVKDPATGEPTGMLRNAQVALKGLPREETLEHGILQNLPRREQEAKARAKRQAVRRLFQLYNAQGITSIAERDASRAVLDVYLAMRARNELTVRVNVARSFDPSGTRAEIIRQYEDLPGTDHLGGPTGVGDEWVRIGPIKLYVDGGILSGTAFMRQPWPRGDTYQITDANYRGLLVNSPEHLQMAIEEGVRRGWRMTAHAAGEGAIDVLLDAYEQVDRQFPIKDRRFCISNANFPSQHNLERSRRLGVCADVQPAWLFKDGTTLANVLGPDRMRWFHPYRTWMRYATIGGGSDHMIKVDSEDAVNPWNPWLGMWVTLTRTTERGIVLPGDESLTREQAIAFYTINNATLNAEEKEKGSLEVGKLADLIVIDRDVLTCPTDAIRDTKVLYTVVGGRVVYERRNKR